MTHDEVADDPANSSVGNPASAGDHDEERQADRVLQVGPLFGDDERVAKLFERVRGDGQPVDADERTGGVVATSTTTQGAVRPPAPPMQWPAPAIQAKHRRRIWPMVVLPVVAVLLVGGVLAAFELSKSGTDTTSALTSAVLTTRQSKTADVALSITIAAGAPVMTIAGNGDADLASNATNLTLTFSAGGQPLTERAVIDGPTAFYNLGPLVGTVVPGKSWISMNVGTNAAASGNVGSGGIFTDPRALIAVVGSEGTAVRNLGSSSAGGTQLHRYSVQLGPSGIRRVLASEAMPSFMRAELSSVHYTRLGYVVSVDGTNHLQQIRTTATYSVAGHDFTVTGTMVMSDFGTPVGVVRPPAGEVVSFQQFENVANRDRATAGSAVT